MSWAKSRAPAQARILEPCTVRAPYLGAARQGRKPHNKPQSGWYYARCEQDCNKAFNECEDEKQKEEAERQKKLKFSRMDEAIDWIRSHKAEVAIGTVWCSGSGSSCSLIGMRK